MSDIKLSGRVTWPRIVHIGAWALIVLVAGQWLSTNHHKLTRSLDQAQDSAFASISDSLPPLADSKPATVAPGPVLSQQEAIALDALAVKAGARRLSAEESAMLSAAIAKTQAVPAAAPAEVKVEDSARNRENALADLRGRHASAFFNIANSAVAFSSLDLIFGAVSVAVLTLAVWRLRQAVLAIGRWGLESEQAYRRYDQVFHTGAAAMALKASIDLGLGMLNLYPTGWPQSSEGVVILYGLALAVWLGAPRLIRWRPKRAPGRRELEAQLAEARAKADALAQENSQFI